MMSKLLNLTLHYKGKVLDRVRYCRDFKNKFFIGSDKYLFWQILDSSFPEKHLFVTKKGDQLYLQLPPGSKVSCTKGGQPVDSAYLTKNNILKDNRLLLLPDMTGTLNIAPNWEISYEFKEPFVTVLTPEEKQIASQYARRPQPTSTERFNRNMILLFIVLTIIFVIIFDQFLKKQISYDYTLEQKVAMLQKAEQIKAEALAKPSTFEPTGETPEAVTEKAQQGVTGGAIGGTGTAKSAGAIFGGGFGSFDPSATSAARPIQAVTTAESFVTSRPGRGGGGRGIGTGGGGAGPSGGYSTSFDPNAPRTFSSDIGSVATQAPQVAGSSIRPGVGTIAKATGDQSRLAPSGVVFGQTAQSSQLISSFQSKKVAQVSEGTIAQAPAETKTRYETIGALVNSRRSQINTLYSKWNAIIPFSGSVTIRLLISSSGKVQEALITPNGQIPNGFLTELKQLCESWKFPVTEESDYTFSVRLRQA